MKLLRRFKLLPLIFGLSLCLSLVASGLWLSPSWSQTPTPAATPGLESPAPESDLAVPEENQDEIKVYINFLGFDPIRGELDARFVFIPSGKYINPDTTFLTEDLRFIETFGTTNQEFDLFKDRPIPSPVVKYITYEGDATEYPFDQYSGAMSFYIESRNPAQLGDYVPISYEVNGLLPGFDVQTVVDQQYTTDDYVAMDIKISRSTSVIFFSSLVMIIMWLLAIITFLIALRILFSDRFPEIGLLGFLGALLFAFPAIRNAQPNVPPIGTLGDFLSFFWTELIVVVSLIIVGICWLKRYPKKTTP